MTENPFLSGNFAPVSRECTERDLPVQGRVPEALSGRLLRIGPNPIAPDPASYHWFLGNGMVHGVHLREGRALEYRNRYVRDDELVAAFGWPPVAGPQREGSIGGGLANTNVIAHAGRTYAIVEGGNLPVELDDELDTVARSDFDGTLPGGFSAHPKRDPATGELFAAVYSQAPRIQMVVVGADGRVRRSVDVPTPGSPMVHDCAITERWFVLLDLPVVIDEALAERGVGLPYAWTPDYGARVGLLPREGGAEDVVWCELPEACFAFHPLNAYEDDDGRVVIDVVRHPSMFAPPEQSGPPTLERWLVDPRGGPVKESRLDDRPQEFPRCDERRLGRPHRYGYSVQLGPGLQGLALLKHDLRAGRTETWAGREEDLFMEPVFVPRSADAAEDDGWVLAYAYDRGRDTGQVVILEAADFAAGPVARIDLPQRVPYGFHGNWVTDPS